VVTRSRGVTVFTKSLVEPRAKWAFSKIAAEVQKTNSLALVSS
jgi:hypothetical protein